MADQRTLRRRLVKELRRRDYLHSERVAEAFAAVPRHLFVPGQRLKDVYTDRAFITKRVDGVPVSSSSQPSIMAIMLEQLELAPGQRVLEIGAGTGYNAALLSQLVGERGRVTTVDIDAEVADGARAHLRSARYTGVTVLAADGGLGWPEGAAHDRIIATASCWQIPQPWVDQLAEGGILVLPFRLNGAHISFAFRKEGDRLVSGRAAMCGFMPLRGVFGPVHTQVTLPGMRVAADVELGPGQRASLAKTLSCGRAVKVAYPRARDALNTPLYFLALQGKPVLNMFRETDGWGSTPFGLMAAARSVIALPWVRPLRGRLTVYGGDEAIAFLRQALARWHAEGRPDLRQLRARVRPARASARGGLPRRVDGRYRFRRGDHLYELWFER